MSKTKRKWLLRIAGLLLFLFVAGTLILPTTRIRIFGYLRGEAFFEGMPTSYWRAVVKDQLQSRGPRTPTVWDRILGYLGLELPRPPWMGGPTRDAAIPVLLEFLKDDDPRIRLFAADTLRLNGNGHVALPVVIELLDHDDRRTRLDVTILLARFNVSLAEVVPSLIRNLERDPESASYYVSALKHHGTDARLALPSLLKLLEVNSDRNVALLAWSIDPGIAIARSRLRQELQNQDLWLIGYFYHLHRNAPERSETKHAAALILELLQDPQVNLSAAHRQMLIRVLRDFDPEAAKAGLK